MQLEMPIGRGLPEIKRRAHDGPQGCCIAGLRSVPSRAMSAWGQPRPKHLGRWANHVRNARQKAYTISDAAPGDGRNTNELCCSPSRQPRAHRVNRVNLLLDRLRL